MEYSYVLYAGIIIFGGIAIYTDIRYREIKNTHLLFALGYALIAHLSYATLHSMYISWKLLAIDFILAFIISFVLYIKPLWSAGDAKFFFVLCMFIPHRARAPLFLFYTLYVFINISLVSFAEMLRWAIKRSFKAAVPVTLSEVKDAIKKFSLSLLVIFSVSWIIWAAFSKFPGKSGFWVPHPSEAAGKNGSVLYS